MPAGTFPCNLSVAIDHLSHDLRVIKIAIMNQSVILSLFLLGAVLFASCEKDEGKLPDISFKTGGAYTSADATLPGGTDVTIGIEAAKTEEKDVLVKFNISRSIDGGTPATVFDKSLTGSEGDQYDYDFTTTLDNVSGQTNEYTFTVTNRDGLINQVSLTLTVQ